jgi:hypothetical protein
MEKMCQKQKIGKSISDKRMEQFSQKLKSGQNRLRKKDGTIITKAEKWAIHLRKEPWPSYHKSCKVGKTMSEQKDGTILTKFEKWTKSS